MNLENRLACLPRIVHSLALRSRVQECFTANLERMLEHMQSRVGRVLSLNAADQRKLKRMVFLSLLSL
jgi:GTP cyclohydrolase I